MNDEQLSRFRAALAMLPPAPASLAASGGAYLGTDYHFDLVRPGVGALWRRPRRKAAKPHANRGGADGAGAAIAPN